MTKGTVEGTHLLIKHGITRLQLVLEHERHNIAKCLSEQAGR